MSTNPSIVNSVKVWLFPGMLTVMSAMIWHDVRSLQDDVKLVLAQSNIDKTNIANMEQRVTNLEQAVFFSKTQKTTNNNKPKPIFSEVHAVLVKEDDDDENKF
jgi:hypothetical protein